MYGEKPLGREPRGFWPPRTPEQIEQGRRYLEEALGWRRYMMKNPIGSVERVDLDDVHPGAGEPDGLGRSEG